MAGRVFKRGKTYWLGFSYHGKEYRRSCKTDKKREAERQLTYWLSQCALNQFQGFEADRATLTVGEVLDDFVTDATQRGLRDLRTLTMRVRVLKRQMAAYDAGTLIERQIDLYVKHRQGKGIQPAILSVELQYLSQALRLAQRKKLLKEIPHIPRFKFNNARQGFFEREEFERVVTLLPPYLQDFTRFGYMTGWRVKEIATLEWRDIVDGTIRLRPDVSKNAEGRVLMLVGALATLIARRRAAREDLMPLVFHHNGKRLTDFSKAWRRACREAGVAGKLFHDLRRTAARNMRKAGVDQGVRMQIIGHKTQAMDRRYNIVDEEDIRQGQLQTDAYLATLEPVVMALTGAQTTHT